MLAEAFEAVEQTGLATGLRASTWAYPLVNAAHILGIGLLYGSVAALDLRLLGVGRSTSLEGTRALLVPVAIAGLTLAVAAGALLFVTDASDYAASPFFRGKIVLIVLALANALTTMALIRRSAAAGVAPGRLARCGALLSLALWSGVIVLGRLVGYF